MTLGSHVGAAPRDDRRVSLGRTLNTFEQHAADCAALVKRREYEWQQAMQPSAVARALQRLERARARHTQACKDAERHGAAAMRSGVA